MARLVLGQPPPNYQEGMHAGLSAEFVHSFSFNIFPLFATIIKQKMNCVFLLCWVIFILRNCKFVFHLKKCHIPEHRFQTQPSVTSVCRLQPRWGDQTQVSWAGLLSRAPQPWSGSVSPTTCVTLRWSTAILQDYILSRASNLLWLAWPNFGSKGTFFSPLGFTDYTLGGEEKNVLKGILTLPFLKEI